MAETKVVRAVERAEVEKTDVERERPRKKSRAMIHRDFKFYPFADALRHLVIKESRHEKD
jgi:hypothetical protein